MHNGVDSQNAQIEFNSVPTIEAFLANLRVLELLLEVRPEILVFMATQIGFGRVRIPQDVLREIQSTRIQGVDDEERGVLG